MKFKKEIFEYFFICFYFELKQENEKNNIDFHKSK
jgi:hypothetical protein